MASSAEELGRAIANIANQGNSTREDLLADDLTQNMLFGPTDNVKVTLSVTGTRFSYPSTSFILDHPVYCDLDSATLEIDGGHAIGSTTLFTYNS